MNIEPVCALAGALLLTLAPAPAAYAQAPGTTSPIRVCAEADDVTAAHLYGLWQLTLWPLDGAQTTPASTGTVSFERHPAYPGSVRGSVQRSAADKDGVQALVSGDVTGGEFNLDESADGVTMDAVWNGAPQDCGQAIRGLRRPAEGRTTGGPAFNFLLTKTPGWR